MRGQEFDDYLHKVVVGENLFLNCSIEGLKFP